MMIDSKKCLMDYLAEEKRLYIGIGYKGKIHAWITQCEVGKLYQFIVVLRKDEYYSNLESKTILQKFCAIYYRRKHNVLGIRLGITIPINTFGKGLLIYHSQGIIVHRDVRCGKNCKLHGLNCIGNKGIESAEEGCPVIGDFVDIGVGASVIGNVRVASNTMIAAGAVLCKSVCERHQVVAGVPAKCLMNRR